MIGPLPRTRLTWQATPLIHSLTSALLVSARPGFPQGI